MEQGIIHPRRDLDRNRNLPAMAVAAFLVLLAGPFLAAAADDPVKGTASSIVTTTSMVSVNVVVLDHFGFPVPGLKAKDFTVFDNGKEQKITNFQETSNPLNVLLIIDSSGSTYKKMSLIKQGAVDFIRRLGETRPSDHLAVVNFNDDINLIAPFESSWREKAAIVQDRIDAMGGTALYDAIYLSVKDIVNKTAGRKIVILYTDGIDNKSLKSFNEALRVALSSDAVFNILTVDNLKQALEDADKNYYALTRQQYYQFIEGESASRGGSVEPHWTANMRSQYDSRKVLEQIYRISYEMLQRLASTSGGIFHKVETYEELPDIYRRIAAEMPYYYTIAYQPDFSGAKEGDFHTIEIRLADPSHEARHRRGYYFSAKR